MLIYEMLYLSRLFTSHQYVSAVCDNAVQGRTSLSDVCERRTFDIAFPDTLRVTRPENARRS